MSPAQLEAYEAGEIERLTLGVFRCPVGRITCPEGECSDSCGCCDYAGL
jgi:hypothetical protein